MSLLSENYFRVLEEVASAARSAGRDPGSVLLLPVSKTYPAGDVETLWKETGVTCFGENKVQELMEKVPVLSPEIQFHLIGHLQSNKAAKAVELSACIHSVDSVRLAQKIASGAEKIHKKIRILLEVNISGEESKFGLSSYQGVEETALAVRESEFVELCGLMTMAPAGAAEDVLHKTFSGLRLMRDRLSADLGKPLPELSMGMTSDFRIAVAEGATIVRVGTAIFGARNYSV